MEVGLWTVWCPTASLALTTALEGYTLEFQHTVHWGPDGTLHFHQTTVFEGKPIFYCNSTTLTDQPRQHWIREACGPDELNSRHEYCKKQYSAHKQWFQDIDQTIGGTAKILQRRGGCSVGVSGAIVFDAWGLNGGDFLAFEHEGLTWTPVSELASSVALKWNKEHSCSSNAVREDDYYTHFSQQVCEKFGHEIQSWYKETDQTGVRIQLTKNGIPLHSGVKLIGPRPKGDGTNQMRVQAQMSLSDTKGYRCNIHRRSFDFSVLWDANTLEVQYMVYRDTNHTLQFQQTTLFNGQVVFTCSSQTLRDQPRQEWVTHTFTQEQLQQRHMECRGQYEEHMSWYAKIQETTSRTAEVLQRRRGCMTNSSGVSAFDEWGVNGEDFLTFDPQTMKWTALSNMATTVAAEWNKLDIRNGVYSTFGQSVCPEMQDSFKNMQLQIFAKAIPGSTFSYLECQVTASDLSGVRIQLTKDGVLLHSEVKLIGPRPNGDGTNQMRVWVVTTLESTRTYGCEAHSKAANVIVKSVLFVSSGTHEIQYTVRLGTNNKPQFQQTTLFNGQVIFTCSSPALLDQPRQEWVTHTFTQEQLQQRHKQCESQFHEHLAWFRRIEKNIPAGILQRRHGCMTNSSGVSMFDEWGVNGEDFLTFDPETLTWTAVSDLAITMAVEWNKLDIRNHVYSNFGQSVCPEDQDRFKRGRTSWISETAQTGVRIQLTKDGAPLHSWVKLIGPRPNGDGTNQMRVQAQISLSDTKGYRCNVHRRSFDFSVLWDGLAGDASGLMRALLYCFAVLVAVLLYMAVMQTVWQSD
ncbi:hypothetical protein ACEWY4_022701 [Coilia grayii]|uniref:MHC class I-like antigen recognition-like domain-containing protein n=1 Tax=Coilia grayii TaxID=363190 RepID=A0ABD1J0X8_9TELE